ncbi:hypothetical protein CR513_31609, partial [Mucuna pruriens]
MTLRIQTKADMRKRNMELNNRYYSCTFYSQEEGNISHFMVSCLFSSTISKQCYEGLRVKVK